MINKIANLVTFLSLLNGFMSIFFSLQGDFTFAAWAIIVAVIFDGLDGQIARLNHNPSVFGKQLDSLTDVVSFGVAPSILGYTFIYRNFYVLGIAILFLYLICSIVRLAKFNIISKEEMVYYFWGLPTTMSGGLLASFVLFYRRIVKAPPESLVFLLVVFVLSLVMISRVKYLNLDGLIKLLGKKIWLFLPPALALLIIFPEPVIFLIFLSYTLFSPLMAKRVK
jgi:CDP-diacylglycerol--serine O-phosphatidyltransferase